jgi:hypothetical protein
LKCRRLRERLQYWDFDPTFAAEKLREVDGITLAARCCG